jgi:hypothetical protein
MEMRTYEDIKNIKASHPAVKGWILQTPGGASFILAPDDEEPTQRVALLGVIEK